MYTKNIFDDKALFEVKYTLYGDMLYKLGIIYFGLGKNNQMCQEAISEAFLWLLTRRKTFKNPEKERIDLIRHMVLICESKRKRKSKNLTQTEEETFENSSCFSEATDMLETVKSLPNKYKSVVHLALYEKLDLSSISRLIYIIEPIVKNRLKKGIELMEMTMEKEVSMPYYFSMLAQLEPPEHMKEELLYYLSSTHKTKKYLTLLQKAEIILSTAAVAIAVVMFVQNYSKIEYTLRVKYYLLSGKMCSVTLDNLLRVEDTGLFVTYDNYENTKYQLYTIENGSLKHVDSRHISHDIYFSEKEFHLEFLCYNNGSGLKVIPYNEYFSANNPVYSSIEESTEDILITLNWTDEEKSYAYPLILNTSTMETTDFLKGCKLLDLSSISCVEVNNNLTEAIVMTWEGELFYCNANSSSINKIATYKDSYLTNVSFLDGGNILYKIEAPGSAEGFYTINYYEYSIDAGTIRSCYNFSFNYGFGLLHSGSSGTVVTIGNEGQLSAIDVRSQKSTTIPIIGQEMLSSIYCTEGSDGKRIMFECLDPGSFDDIKVNSIYIYNTETCKTASLKLSDYTGVEFSFAQWCGNNHIAIEVRPKSSADSSSHTSTSGAASPKKAQNTFWIFDINKLQ
jgi:DNA-directed RNA polymerase specialized sigma24 family protein